MATTEDRLVIRQLEAARGHLLARGDAEAVKSLDVILGRLGEPEPAPEASATSTPASPPPPNDLLTAREAADALGIRSTGKVWQWVEEGRLTFKTVGSQQRITRASLVKLLADPVVDEQRRFERELSADLAPFEGDEEDVEELLDWYHRGRQWSGGE